MYTPLILDRRNVDDQSRTAYVTNIHALIRDLAKTYIRRRQPGVSEEKIQEWVRAYMSVATQETFLSHYRIGLDGD